MKNNHFPIGFWNYPNICRIYDYLYSDKVYNSNLGTLTAPTANEDDDTAHTIVITNVFETISPTGVIIRSAPYMLLFAAGVVLLVVVRRGKKNEEEEEA